MTRLDDSSFSPFFFWRLGSPSSPVRYPVCHSALSFTYFPPMQSFLHLGRPFPFLSDVLGCSGRVLCVCYRSAAFYSCRLRWLLLRPPSCIIFPTSALPHFYFFQCLPQSAYPLQVLCGDAAQILGGFSRGLEHRPYGTVYRVQQMSSFLCIFSPRSCSVHASGFKRPRAFLQHFL